MNHRLADALAGLGIENLGALLLRGSNHESPVQAETRARISVGRFEGQRAGLAVLHIPDLSRTVLGRCDDELSARIEFYVGNRTLVLERFTLGQPRQRVPYSSRTARRTSGQALAVGAHNKVRKRSFRLDRLSDSLT